MSRHEADERGVALPHTVGAAQRPLLATTGDRTRAERPGNESRKRRTPPIAFLALRRDTTIFSNLRS